MKPIQYDLMLAVLALAFGLYSLFARLHAQDRHKYTPALPAMTVLMGLLCWFILCVVTFAGITQHPNSLYNAGWEGSWGYTISRFFGVTAWLMTLSYICKTRLRVRPKTRIKIKRNFYSKVRGK